MNDLMSQCDKECAADPDLAHLVELETKIVLLEEEILALKMKLGTSQYAMRPNASYPI